MLAGSWPPRKRLSIAIIATALIYILIIAFNRSSESVVSLLISSYNGNHTTEQNTGKCSPGRVSPAHAKATYETRQLTRG